MRKTLSVLLGIMTILALVAMPIYPTSASQGGYLSQNDPQATVCVGLGNIGIPCATSGVSVGNYEPKPIHLNLDPFTPSSSSVTSNSDLAATINNAKAPKDLTGQKINIVSVPESPEIYELVNGEKHPFPSLAVYYDYGYTLAMIQSITQDQLDKYPRAHLLKVKGDTKVYYLTEGGLVRQIINPKKIMDFYGDRPEDIITISRKEFNFYPTNEYVYQFSPFNRDVFQVSASGKRYLTPMAMARLGIRSEQIAPVTKAELDSYKTLPPVID